MCESLRKQLEILKGAMAKTNDFLIRMQKSLDQAGGKADQKVYDDAFGLYMKFLDQQLLQQELFEKLVMRLKELSCGVEFSFKAKPRPRKMKRSKSKSRSRKSKAKGKAKTKKPKRRSPPARKRRYSY